MSCNCNNSYCVNKNINIFDFKSNNNISSNYLDSPNSSSTSLSTSNTIQSNDLYKDNANKFINSIKDNYIDFSGLVDLFKEHGSFKDILEMAKQIATITNNQHYISNFFNTKLNNKEIPTYELFDYIINIISFFNIKEIYIISDNFILFVNLLSAYLKKKNIIDYKIKLITDNKIEISLTKDDNDVIVAKNNIKEFKPINNNNLFIFYDNCSNYKNGEIEKFIENNKDNVFLNIGTDSIQHYKILSKFSNAIFTNNLLQFSINHHYDALNGTSQIPISAITSIYKTIDSNESDVLNNNFKHLSCYNKHITNLDFVNIYLYNMYINNLIPEWILYENPDNMLLISKIIAKIIFCNYKKRINIIPKYIYNINELKIWSYFIFHNGKNYPIAINNNKKFNLFIHHYNNIFNVGLKYYIDNKLVPIWVTNIVDYQYYLWAIFSDPKFILESMFVYDTSKYQKNSPKNENSALFSLDKIYTDNEIFEIYNNNTNFRKRYAKLQNYAYSFDHGLIS